MKIYRLEIISKLSFVTPSRVLLSSPLYNSACFRGCFVGVIPANVVQKSVHKSQIFSPLNTYPDHGNGPGAPISDIMNLLITSKLDWNTGFTSALCMMHELVYNAVPVEDVEFKLP